MGSMLLVRGHLLILLLQQPQRLNEVLASVRKSSLSINNIESSSSTYRDDPIEYLNP